jgi:hypothetical protein
MPLASTRSLVVGLVLMDKLKLLPHVTFALSFRIYSDTRQTVNGQSDVPSSNAGAKPRREVGWPISSYR